MLYDQLLSETEAKVFEKDIPLSIKGLYGDNVIWINKRIQSRTEKACILAEENGHHYTSSGDILKQESIKNRKQEKRARNWAYEKLIPISTFVQAHLQGIRNRHELADHLGVTEDFLDSAIRHFQEKYGLRAPVGDYTVIFEPLGVLELFKEVYAFQL
ncbi:ImmA/IrrE family metallo-endopeptidase [Brevibacillus daliensis]|uniref:ImmA/IrrE family metallo-endopeptidase n=1 Tax=Brevibacillus daliensis TaxID=2892995 RepID=UPI001E5548E7|nr:ImmA/IrrE family metallo-endopeptidase [Brevibacillus daliensis]